ncbi:ATP-dependent helicase HrpB [Deinococcus sp. Arct2-2]|uniref:ATP-dependent helicase HrpB n=1 Tax=Deinococcus sp. Arct2-2 TaxID=2568653 RepID=UPI0010A4C6C5|nr:ATP-dependent helicase HrpB [Deinococcus sp. Arct2-2]THF71369.1 ATP-dependent helicase HrpB [Deinococcus sp. Arct2-2]
MSAFPLPPTDLPIAEVIPAVRAALQDQGLVVVQAPPGAGKSTALPLALLHEPWLAGQTIVMLQPRRVAARAVASRMAETLGEEVGQSVGYRVRFESRVSAATRIEVVTEGILTRRLQRDPELAGVGLVILDEFHERSLNADLALALLREVQGALRDDLRVLVMSATLNADLPARLNAPLIESAGRAYPVEMRYLSADPVGRVEDAVRRAVRSALEADPGDILAFLPGVREIRGAAGQLADLEAAGIAILPLYGDLPLAAQRRALLPDPDGRRKVVLATSIAETSLTIAGVRVVIDGGQSRTQRFDPASGLSRMVTGRVTRDSATQRAGRAGRTAPGVAYRLWSERTHALLPAASLPEVLEADLAPLTLELAQWGTPDPATLNWLDVPPAPRVALARTLLHDLDALDKAGRVTAAGARLLDFPTHPRLAHLLNGAEDGALAADVAALLEERDPLPPGSGADLTERVAALRAWRRGERTAADVAVLERVERLSKQWRTLLKVRPDSSSPDGYDVGALVALAYPERAALAREDGRGRFLLAGGQGAALPEGDPLAGASALAVAHLDATPGAAPKYSGSAEGRIFLAAPLDRAALEARAEAADVVRWDSRTGTLLAERQQRVGALVLGSQPLRDLPAGARAGALTGAIRAEGLHLLNFSPEAAQLRTRVESVRHWRPDDSWPDLSDKALLNTLETWLSPHLGSARSREDLGRIHLLPALQALLPWPLPAQLDELAPTHLSVPTGSRIRLEYRPSDAPILAVKLQELFGLAETPTVNGGRTPVLLHLLSPAGRPVQVTQDLRSFWNSSYFEVRKDLRGRYPKHPWPEDPWTHAPMKGIKKRGV